MGTLLLVQGAAIAFVMGRLCRRLEGQGAPSLIADERQPLQRRQTRDIHPGLCQATMHEEIALSIRRTVRQETVQAAEFTAAGEVEAGFGRIEMVQTGDVQVCVYDFQAEPLGPTISDGSRFRQWASPGLRRAFVGLWRTAKSHVHHHRQLQAFCAQRRGGDLPMNRNERPCVSADQCSTEGGCGL